MNTRSFLAESAALVLAFAVLSSQCYGMNRHPVPKPGAFTRLKALFGNTHAQVQVHAYHLSTAKTEEERNQHAETLKTVAQKIHNAAQEHATRLEELAKQAKYSVSASEVQKRVWNNHGGQWGGGGYERQGTGKYTFERFRGEGRYQPINHGILARESKEATTLAGKIQQHTSTLELARRALRQAGTASRELEHTSEMRAADTNREAVHQGNDSARKAINKIINKKGKSGW